ncbi:MAG TPA: enoyl-CoA hydratase family protein [Sandaracinaceae bacterium LLY-WYZ-13_1]|nr:enoyl-CoA hydratase family protein [Sandaracinaceae bacterium LLY-WYZ-13_1]
MTIEPESFRWELDDAGVATITLDRPDRINALTFQVYAELRDTFRALREDRHPDVRAVVLQGEGPRGFCSGGDVNDIIGRLFERDMKGLLEFTRMTGALVQAIRTCRPPVIAALHRVTCGAGAVMAIACDVRVAAPDLRMAYLFPRVGLSGADMGAAWLLPRIVGHGRASDLLLTGRFVEAEEAARIGLVTRVVDDGEKLREEAHAFARTLADGPAFAHAMTKRMIEYEAHVDFRTGIEAEAQAQAICMQHPDFREAYDAFVDKRDPRFER